MKKDNRRYWGGILSNRKKPLKYRYKTKLNLNQHKYVKKLLDELGK